MFKRNRPVQVSFICAYFICSYMYHTAPLYAMILDLIGELFRGGLMQFKSSYRANVKPEHWITLFKVITMFIALGGLWVMRRWGVAFFIICVSARLYSQISSGNVMPIQQIFEAACMFAVVYYFVKATPTHSASRQLLEQKIAGESQAQRDDFDEYLEPTARKNPLDELIY